MKIVRTILCVLCALLFCQLPSFSRQYAIRLEAHYLELQKVREAYFQVVFQYVGEKAGHAQAEYGDFLEKRYSRFKSALEHLNSSNPIFQPMWMGWGFDREIAKETWRGYSPGLFFNIASLVWGLVGAVFGELMLASLGKLFRRNTESKSTG